MYDLEESELARFIDIEQNHWNILESVYFCLVVITTIGRRSVSHTHSGGYYRRLGYGHTVPETKLGKMICVVYSIIGIPLCLVAFQTVGNKINNLISQLFSKFTVSRGVVIPQICLIFLVFLYSVSGAGIFSVVEGMYKFCKINY